MRQVKNKNTAPELKVRRLLRSLGHTGYRLHPKNVVGKPDIVWIGRRLAIFVHGCFWHGHSCPRGSRVPKTNFEYWQNKIGRNVERDKESVIKLDEIGWKVLIVWECQLKDIGELTSRLQTLFEKTNV